MAYKQNRRIVRFGAASCGITLPKGWLEFYEFQPGSPVVIIGDSILVIAHPGDEERARRVLHLLEQGQKTGK
ncbi:hypothetical protein ES703_74739 [subsurface metagenome]